MAKNEEAVVAPKFIVLAASCIVLAGLYFAQEVLIPIALAVLFSFLLGPLVTRLEKFKFPRVLAVIVTVLFAFSILFGISFVVYKQVDEVSSGLTRYKQNIQTKMNGLKGPLAWLNSADTEVKKVLAPTSKPAASSETTHQIAPVDSAPQTESSPSSGSPLDVLKYAGELLLGPLGKFFIVTVFTIFMLLQREDLRDRVIRLVGRNRLTMTTQALDDAATRVSRYLLMQSITNGSVGLVIMACLWGIGKFNHLSFPAVALWGLLAALLRFIPYVGIWTAAILPILLSLAVFPQYRVTLETIFAYGTVEVIAGNVVEPLLYGSSTGIATLAVLVAAAFWTWLWGPVGLLLSTPLTVCLVVMGKYVPQLEFLTILLAEEPALSPSDRVYQRLLALDHEEAADLIEEYSKKMPLEELYDSVMVPALAKSELDLQRGKLDEARHKGIQDGLRALVDEMGDQARAEMAKARADASVDQARGENPEPVKPQGTPGAVPRGCTVNVVCLPANGASDEIAATMLAQLLELRGYCVVAASVTQLASEMVEMVGNAKADLVCISALPPAAVTHARYICKRLYAKHTELRMLVGLWASERDMVRAKDRISFVNSIQIAGKFSQALEQVHQLAQTKITQSTLVDVQPQDPKLISINA